MSTSATGDRFNSSTTPVDSPFTALLAVRIVSSSLRMRAGSSLVNAVLPRFTPTHWRGEPAAVMPGPHESAGGNKTP